MLASCGVSSHLRRRLAHEPVMQSRYPRIAKIDEEVEVLNERHPASSDQFGLSAIQRQAATATIGAHGRTLASVCCAA